MVAMKFGNPELPDGTVEDNCSTRILQRVMPKGLVASSTTTGIPCVA
ncbi:hypothetical protein RISK_006521 [Rhodopirellula islandica]|uniref:Uncharacterized protein n=1 Tax=Rhodopirellula islandica TaxID=595434 RepID=A0A0J1B385_RHOIS|nr:hypothetical protein RISK_006521 [Rhodopirellula islandica]